MLSTFSQYMIQFIKEQHVETIVEAGSDSILRLALNLAPHCKTFYSVNFPEDHLRMQGWYEMHKAMGVPNITLLSGNVVNLPALIDHTDLVILQNLLIAPSDADMELLMSYRRGEVDYTDDQWDELDDRFEQAEIDAYKGFLQVAKPGHIVRFSSPLDEPFSEGGFRTILTSKVGIDSSRIQVIDLLENIGRQPWKAYIIDNTQAQ